MALQIFIIIFGIILLFWGIYRMKTDKALAGNTQTKRNIFNLFLFGEASGIGQFVGGILCIGIGISSFFIK